MLISIIIVNHNTGDILKECIDSINKFENPDDFEIIIVDNFSQDNSNSIIENLKKKYSNVKSLYFKKLEGFSFANNRGFENSTGEYILIMNPDVIFTEPLFKKLVKSFKENDKIGAISPALLSKDGNFQRNYFQRYPSLLQFIFFYSIFAKIFYRFPSLMNRYLENQDIDANTRTIYNVEQIPCAFFLTTNKIYRQAGMMDEKFKLFFEDVDLSYQIGKNYKLKVDTSIRVKHLGGASFISKEKWELYGNFIMGMNYFFEKHYNILQSFLLKYFSITNSIFIASLEYCKKIIGMGDDFRLQKHKYFLKLFRNYYI